MSVAFLPACRLCICHINFFLSLLVSSVLYSSMSRIVHLFMCYVRLSVCLSVCLSVWSLCLPVCVCLFPFIPACVPAFRIALLPACSPLLQYVCRSVCQCLTYLSACLNVCAILLRMNTVVCAFGFATYVTIYVVRSVPF